MSRFIQKPVRLLQALPGKKLFTSRGQAVMVVVLGVAVVGTYALIRSYAASSSLSLEAEQGSVSGAASTISDTAASGGIAVQFGKAAGLPAGVTLKDIDGGANYYAKWKNSFPTDPSFFPFAIFDTSDLAGKAPNGMKRIEGYKAIGINTFVNLVSGALAGSPPDLQVVKDYGMYAIISPEQSYLNSTFSTTYGSSAAGYVYEDELDGSSDCDAATRYYPYLVTTTCTIGDFTKINPDILLNMSNNLRARDPTRPVYMGYTNAYALDWYPGGPVSTLADAADIIGYDVYVMVDRRNTFGGQISPGHAWAAYDVVSSARKNADFKKPVWPDVETSATDTDNGMNTTNYEPTGRDVAALVWNYIIGGARGITYFNHCICSNLGKTSADDLNNPPQAEIRSAVQAVDAQVKALAPVINAPFANGYVTTDQGKNVSLMSKYYNGQFYIFAAPHASGARTATFTIKSGSSVTVLNENRTLPISGGTFSDSFADENTVHIYKVNP